MFSSKIDYNNYVLPDCIRKSMSANEPYDLTIKKLLKSSLKCNSIMSLESSDNLESNMKSTSSLLDFGAGIDYFAVYDFGLKGIASRIDFRSSGRFTIRYKRATGSITEYEKRTRQIESEMIYPYYTVQFNVKKGKVCSFAIITTKLLYDIALDIGTVKTNHTDNNQYIEIPYSALKDYDEFVYNNIALQMLQETI